ncbi:MAG: glutamine synthetase family protein [Actinobacteria bacterium]|nr:glutamine synthetase family protein [Actinomycetota bacterium]MBU4218562.1 glutamine synthetase family protein [Actinomycetota bacterium]MBU4391574.1 glutamine synthetase family protein [Actinomycetota bacterium]MBU4401341.1 glutamine synthetase family protein [Actinomycetota bacterium]MCG2818447.1 glutamine synthetase family protein [Actinomycetes bacterium]
MVESADREYVLEAVREHDVKFIRFWFTDILGFLKSFAITREELEEALEEGMGFDGSSIQGYARIDESDMIAMPDTSTFAILPWRPSGHSAVARVFCDILEPDGSPHLGDPRYVLKRNLKKANDMGFTFYVGPELEYYYFKKDEPPPEVLDRGGYFDLTPLDMASDLRRETVLTLEDMGIGVEYSHHEVGPSQHEIDLRYTDALRMADNAMTYRLVVKEVAMKHGVYGTFMPKPLQGENGSGMHTHMSLFKGDRNAFYDADDEYYLSGLAKEFLAGLLKYAPEFCLVTNQWVNSYKRLVPGYEAPVYLSWAQRNRSDLIRVPTYKPGKESATRIELRSPDPACNPYLAFSAMLAAGLKGIEEHLELEEPIERNIYEMSEKEREEKGVTSLPADLWEAIQVAERSDFLRECLGDHVFNSLITDKKIEWEEYKAVVTEYELETNLPVL